MLLLASAACATPSSHLCSPLPVVRRPPSPQQGVSFRNEMRGAFRLVRALFVLDGAVLFDAAGSREVPLPSEIVLVPAPVPQGEHVLQVLLQLAGCEHISNY